VADQEAVGGEVEPDVGAEDEQCVVKADVGRVAPDPALVKDPPRERGVCGAGEEQNDLGTRVRALSRSRGYSLEIACNPESGLVITVITAVITTHL
jgi:hypothetical protein